MSKRVIRYAGLGASAAVFCAAAALGSPAAQPTNSGTNEIRTLAVRDIHGTVQRPLADSGQKATVFFFILPDCPLANRCAPEINRIAADYRARGVRSFVAYVGDDISANAARQHAKEYGFTCPVLLEGAQHLVRFTGVTISPEAAVLSPGNKLLYRGRVDDRLIAFGKQRPEPTRHDLREALDAILDGKPVPTPITKAVGCYLPDANEPEKSKNSR